MLSQKARRGLSGVSLFVASYRDKPFPSEKILAYPRSYSPKRAPFPAIATLALASACALGGCGDAVEAPEANTARVAVTAEIQPLPLPSRDGIFTDVTLAAGIRARHQLPSSTLRNIVDSVGSGAAFADLDGDGWLDLVVLGGPPSPQTNDAQQGHAGLHIYQNLRNGRFEDITARSGIPTHSTAVAVAIADVDGDGDRDLYLVDRGPNRLYRNRGDAVFDDVTSRSGVGDTRFGVGAAFFDLEGDGDLDLYVINYLDFDPRENAFYAPDGFPGPLAYPAESDVLYRNEGDGTFVDVSETSGVDALAGRGMSLAVADFDDDRDVDIFVANDATENFLLLNDGRGQFVEAGFNSGLAMGVNGEQTSAMAVDVGDVDGDGQLDLVVSDISYGALYLRTRPGLFVDRTIQSGLSMLCGQYVSWGQNLLDFDNDGDLDLFVVNGGLKHLVGWEDLLLRNVGAAKFEDASSEGGAYFATRQVGRSSIAGDYDNDGDIDLFVTTLGGRHFLLRNDHAGSAGWITLDLVGDGVRDSFGARVKVVAGGRTFAAESRFPSTYLGQSDSRIHVGLGQGVEQVDRIQIDWPDGVSQTLTDVSTGQILQIHQRAR